MTEKPLVFVSHAREDEDIAIALEQWVHDRFFGGVDVFVSSAGAGIRGGQRWMERVEATLRASQIVLVVCTPASLSKRWLFFEAGGAFFLNALVIPLCARGTTRNDLEAPLSLLQAYDLGNPRNVSSLLRQIAEHAGLGVPEFDAARDSTWLSTGTRPRPVTVQAAGTARFSAVTLEEARRLESEVDAERQSRACKELVAFHTTWDGRSLIVPARRSAEQCELAKSPAWTRHLGFRMAAANLPAPPAAGGVALAARLEQLADDGGWDPVNALLSLQAMLPAVMPVIAHEILLLQRFDGTWPRVIKLAELISGHGGELALRTLGTLLRLTWLDSQEASFEHLISQCQRIISDPIAFAGWLEAVAGRSYPDLARVRPNAAGTSGEM